MLGAYVCTAEKDVEAAARGAAIAYSFPCCGQTCCARCAALRADRLNPTGQPRTATRSGALSALARRGKGRGATFGVLMDIASILDQSETTLRVGDALRPELIHPKAGA